jgi:hypothetical protein
MAENPPPDLQLTSLRGDSRTVTDWLTVFHLLVVAVNPYDHRSAWIVPTAARILTGYEQADCRVAWLVTGTTEDTRLFLGHWADDILTFVDPDAEAVRALGLETLPAAIHLAHDGTVVNAVEGWQPLEWRAMAANLSRIAGWSLPVIPGPRDPGPFEGAPVPDFSALREPQPEPEREPEAEPDASSVSEPAET